MATDTILRPGEIKDILLREIEAADLHELDVEEVGIRGSVGGVGVIQFYPRASTANEIVRDELAQMDLQS